MTRGLKGAFLWSPLVAERVSGQSDSKDPDVHLEARISSSKQKPKAQSLNYINLLHTCRNQDAFISADN